MAEVHVPPGEATEVARKLLAAAEQLGLPANVVRTSSDGVWGFSFLAPEEVVDLAYGVEHDDEEPEETPAPKKRGRPRKAAASTDEKPEEGE